MAGRLLNGIRKWLVSTVAASDQSAILLPKRHAGPSAFVIDDDDSICKLLSKMLATVGIETETFTTSGSAIAALEKGVPDLIFLDIALKKSDAVDVIRGLGTMQFGGVVQLISGSDIALLEDVRRVGARHGLNMLPPLSKPFRAEAVRQIVRTAKLGNDLAGKVSLDVALSKGWLELWYQPKIDLRAMTLIGAEGLIRCRHPVHGILTPGGWLPGASDSSLATLTEYVVTTALGDWDEIAGAGINLHTAINTSVAALAGLRLASLIGNNRPQSDKWPGLILEVTESDAVKDVALMHEVATQLRIYGVTLAIDDFGEGYSSFARLREMPFAELKLDMSFVKDCAHDKRNAGICKAVIDLAHNFGARAVAEGIDNASDLQEIRRLGCDIGQGFFLARPMPKVELLSLVKRRIGQKQMAS